MATCVLTSANDPLATTRKYQPLESRTRPIIRPYKFDDSIHNPPGWREEMLELLNKHRNNSKLPPMAMDDRLNTVAQAHSVYQSIIDVLTHDDVFGTLGTRVTKAGLRWSRVAENVAQGPRTVERAFQLWADSPAHNANMLGNYTLVGFGWADNDADQASKQTTYWTQVFVYPLGLS
ncbi:hypothetical protein H4R20_001105 [Coemansia guatemalensis]|uniref:SCP domain-containing protein n=1 Tax=Coemansia guatemalensis TaxID=2761395 RepID=A0A9W8I507_9FUNG|nr:hypothetical protein H4R20_001105 [Coemansia guatemalensis]